MIINKWRWDLSGRSVVVPSVLDAESDEYCLVNKPAVSEK